MYARKKNFFDSGYFVIICAVAMAGLVFYVIANIAVPFVPYLD